MSHALSMIFLLLRRNSKPIFFEKITNDMENLGIKSDYKVKFYVQLAVFPLLVVDLVGKIIWKNLFSLSVHVDCSLWPITLFESEELSQATFGWCSLSYFLKAN